MIRNLRQVIAHDLVRVSCGIESPESLVDDFRQTPAAV
jgi:cystathionine beta-lyase/cystathionine gamma-synthase